MQDTLSMMEARGIEPRSEPQSEATSTCVDYALCLRQLVRNQPNRRTIFLNLRSRAEATNDRSQILRYLRAASGELQHRQVLEA